MNGAVQGLAATTASTPEANASTAGRSSRQAARPWGISSLNSKAPIRFKPSAKNTRASANTTPGSCSWKPQPTALPSPRKAIRTPASSTKLPITPTA